MKRSRQQRELTEEERSVVVAVRHCAGELNDILQGARRKAQSNAKLFAETGISVMFRGIDSYADMYDKLKLKSREALERLFSKFADCEEVQDAQDAIEETEGNWRNFLSNLDRDVLSREESSAQNSTDLLSKDSSEKTDVIYFKPSKYPLIDMQTNKEVSLAQYLVEKTCVLVTFQPAYWPDTCVRWRHSEVSKIKADLAQFSVGYLVVTWGPPEEVRSWSKQVTRITKWPVLWDKYDTFCSLLGFNSGLQRIWTADTLDFFGNQRTVNNWPVHPPPTDLNWIKWRRIGGEAVVAQPVVWNPELVVPTQSAKVDSCSLTKRPRTEAVGEDNEATGDNQSTESEAEASRDQRAVASGELKVCMLHRSSHLADLAPSGSVYQAALTCYARLHNTTEAQVMDRIRQNRRFRTAPESARLQLEETSGLYYDPETSLYYDAARGYFYDATDQMYYYWSQSEHRYIPANALIQAELAAAHVAQATAAQASLQRAAAEREAARQAALHVAAQLAEIRANKDDYAAYAYATCVIPQQELEFGGLGTVTSDPSAQLRSVYRNTAAAASTIESSLKAWDQRKPEPLVPYADESSSAETRSSTPPPPGL